MRRTMLEERTYGALPVIIGGSTAEIAEAAAADFAAAARGAIAERGDISVILATGNSQLAFVAALGERDDIAWDRITVLHMDEYLGMSEEHPASFRRWMQERVVEPLRPRHFDGVRGDHVPVEEELDRYDRLLREDPPAICVMGIGENGHLAFNDPPADFDTEDLVRVVEMDEVSRAQQVGEGHFPSLAETPRHAISLTVPALLAPTDVFVLVPEARKAVAVQKALEGPVTASVPASVLREHPHVRVYLDAESSSLLEPRP